MLGALAQHRRLEDFTKGMCNENQVDEMINRLTKFVSHGFTHGLRNSSPS